MERVTLASGIELDTLDVGPRDAPALIFLHGFPESHRTWRHQIAHFSGGYRCIAPDQRGYRGSSKPADVAGYTPDKLLGDVFQLADALGVETFTVVGHDFGGALAWAAAAVGQMTGRVNRAVIANGPHPALFQQLLYLDPAQREASGYIRTFRDPANDRLLRDHGLLGMLMKAFGAQRLNNGIEPEERQRLLEDWQDRDAAFAMLNWYRASPVVVPAMDEPFALPDGWQRPAMPPLTVPTLVVWATGDPALPDSNLDGLSRLVSDLTLVKLADCGHFVPWQAPGAFNAAMEEFLERTA